MPKEIPPMFSVAPATLRIRSANASAVTVPTPTICAEM